VGKAPMVNGECASKVAELGTRWSSRATMGRWQVLNAVVFGGNGGVRCPTGSSDGSCGWRRSGVKGATQKLKGLMWRRCSPRCNDGGGDSADSEVPGGGLRWRSGQMALA
jgi:hypothetical protein